MVAFTIGVEQLHNGVVDDSVEDKVESDDNEGADGYICHSRMSDAIENLATIEHSKEESNICRIEENDMQHMLI